jgi:hypothetical protein
MLDLAKAKQELSQKTYAQIQEETAWTWASRACASYQGCVAADFPAKLALWSLGEEYYHEAIEHAGFSAANPTLLQQIRDAVHPFQQGASDCMGAEPPVDIV